jgi:hypothetical protein
MLYKLHTHVYVCVCINTYICICMCVCIYIDMNSFILVQPDYGLLGRDNTVMNNWCVWIDQL